MRGAVDQRWVGRLALDQVDREGRGTSRLKRGVLEYGAALVATQDALQTRNSRVLTRDRRLDAVLLQDGDNRLAHAVVGSDDAVNLATGCRQQVLEDGAGLCVVPVRDGLLALLDVLASRVQRVEHAVVALRKQRCVVVGRRALELDHDRLGNLRGGHAVDEALALKLANLDVVERHVVGRAATEGEAVVVDRLDAGCGGRGLNLGTRRAVEVDDDEDLHALLDHALTDRDELGFVTERVLDVDLDASCVECLLEVRRVLLFPARRRLGVGKDDADLCAAASCWGGRARCGRCARGRCGRCAGGSSGRSGRRGSRGRRRSRSRGGRFLAATAGNAQPGYCRDSDEPDRSLVHARSPLLPGRRTCCPAGLPSCCAGQHMHGGAVYVRATVTIFAFGMDLLHTRDRLRVGPEGVRRLGSMRTTAIQLVVTGGWRRSGSGGPSARTTPVTAAARIAAPVRCSSTSRIGSPLKYCANPIAAWIASAPMSNRVASRATGGAPSAVTQTASTAATPTRSMTMSACSWLMACGRKGRRAAFSSPACGPLPVT